MYVIHAEGLGCGKEWGHVERGPANGGGGSEKGDSGKRRGAWGGAGSKPKGLA